jgi:hypothetical protein
MTGAYLRVYRLGKWENIEIEHLTNDERHEKLAADDRLIQWLNLVCEKLVYAEEILSALEKDGILARGVQ